MEQREDRVLFQKELEKDGVKAYSIAGKGINSTKSMLMPVLGTAASNSKMQVQILL